MKPKSENKTSAKKEAPANPRASLPKRLVREWVVPILTVVIVLGTFRSAVADWMDVPTGSMLPTIVEGDRILVNKLAFDVRIPFTRHSLSHRDDPELGDIVVFWSPEQRLRLVKRVVGLPGDRIEMKGETLYRNGHPVPQDVLDPARLDGVFTDAERTGHRFSVETLGERRHPVMTDLVATGRERARLRARSLGPVDVPDDHYFMMGDNRDNSRDSRFFGPVPREALIGRVFGVAFSIDRDRCYLPRWERTGTSLP